MSKTIGIDIGGSNIRGVLWNGKKVLRSFALPTPKSLKSFKKLIFEMTNNFGGDGFKVGIGIAGVIKNNKVVSATNIKYLKNFDFSLLSNLVAKLRVDNDARCFAKAEYKIGAGKGAKSALFVTLGTGIGRAYAKNGKILNIRPFEYAEDWEKEYQKIRNKKAIAEFLGEKLGLLIDALNPEVLVLGGGVVEKKGYFEAIKNQLRSWTPKLEIKHAKLGKFAGAIGAAMLWN